MNDNMRRNLEKVQEVNRKKAENEESVVSLLQEISNKLDVLINNQEKSK